MLVRPEQPKKAPSPIEVMPLGMVKDTIDEHLPKARLAMVSMSELMVRFLSEVQP